MVLVLLLVLLLLLFLVLVLLVALVIWVFSAFGAEFASSEMLGFFGGAVCVLVAGGNFLLRSFMGGSYSSSFS
jgi:hypothetical protein